MTTARQELIDRLARALDAIDLGRVLRVGIDGVDGAGKTFMGDELTDALQKRDRVVIRAGVDSFHNPRDVRYARGKDSPEGFFRDSYDYPLLRRELLGPLGRGDAFKRAAFDWRTDSAVDAEPETAPSDAILVFDGIFLHRPELRDHWDYSIYLRTPIRDETARYADGQRLYFAECDPQSHATLVVDNDDFDAPYVVSGNLPT